MPAWADVHRSGYLRILCGNRLKFTANFSRCRRFHIPEINLGWVRQTETETRTHSACVVLCRGRLSESLSTANRADVNPRALRPPICSSDRRVSRSLAQTISEITEHDFLFPQQYSVPPAIDSSKNPANHHKNPPNAWFPAASGISAGPVSRTSVQLLSGTSSVSMLMPV